MKKTLLEDVFQVFYSIPCEFYENCFCSSCGCCKNKKFCSIVQNLIYSLLEVYYESKIKQ